MTAARGDAATSAEFLYGHHAPGCTGLFPRECMGCAPRDPKIMIQPPSKHPRRATESSPGELSRDPAVAIPPDAANSLPGGKTAISGSSAYVLWLDALTCRRIAEYHPKVVTLFDLARLSWLDVMKLPAVGRGRTAWVARVLRRAGLAFRNAPGDPDWITRRWNGDVDWEASIRAWMLVFHSAESARTLAEIIEEEHRRRQSGASPWQNLIEQKPKRRRLAAGGKGAAP